MSINQNNRKRNRSVDADVRTQSKYFVNQRMMDSLDQKYMKTIFGKYNTAFNASNGMGNIRYVNVHLFIHCADKTVGLLFEGAKNNSNNNNRTVECKKEKLKTVRLDGEGNVSFTDGSAGNSDKIRCSSCDRDSLIQAECSNCNLCLCEYCGVSCANCLEAHICKHCVQLL